MKCSLNPLITCTVITLGKYGARVGSMQCYLVWIESFTCKKLQEEISTCFVISGVEKQVINLLALTKGDFWLRSCRLDSENVHNSTVIGLQRHQYFCTVPSYFVDSWTLLGTGQGSIVAEQEFGAVKGDWKESSSALPATIRCLEHWMTWNFPCIYTQNILLKHVRVLETLIHTLLSLYQTYQSYPLPTCTTPGIEFQNRG